MPLLHIPREQPKAAHSPCPEFHCKSPAVSPPNPPPPKKKQPQGASGTSQSTPGSGLTFDQDARLTR